MYGVFTFSPKNSFCLREREGEREPAADRNSRERLHRSPSLYDCPFLSLSPGNLSRAKVQKWEDEGHCKKWLVTGRPPSRHWRGRSSSSAAMAGRSFLAPLTSSSDTSAARLASLSSPAPFHFRVTRILVLFSFLLLKVVDIF